MDTDTFKTLYDRISARKAKPSDHDAYVGGNGRIDRAVDLITTEGFPRGTLLDVGGATGNLGYALRGLFSERYTLDISDECRPASEAKGNTFVCCNVDTAGLPFPDERVDLIAALDFIEHIIDPGKFAAECFRILRPGGMVLVNTPNIQFWRHLESLVMAGRFPHTSGDEEVYHGGHVAFYNAADLSAIFATFSDHRVHTRGLRPDPPPPIWTQLARYQNHVTQLSYADLIFSCRKP